MGGLCSVVTFDGRPVHPELLQAMADAAAHRGLDGIDVWTGEGAGFAHLALHLSAEDERDTQPVRAAGLVGVADARIDNRFELLSALRTSRLLSEDDPSDAQLILAAYRLWGDHCPGRLLGDFAFAIWNERTKTLFAARDVMGARSLYQRVEQGRRALLATEAKQILSAPGVPCRPNEAAIVADLAGLLALPGMTPYEGIAQLPPGHALLIGSDGHRIWRYWDISPGHRIRHRRLQDYEEHFRAVFAAAVGDRLRTHRPVGILLSGGLDSMSVAGTAAALGRAGARPPALHAYTWAFDELVEDDERDVVRLLADPAGLPVTAIPGDDAWPLHGLPEESPDRDDPYMWLYQGLMERSLRQARTDGMGVVFTADRGDEMVGNWPLDDLGLLVSGRWRLLAKDYRTMQRLTGASLRRFALRRLGKPLLSTVWPPRRAPRLRQLLRPSDGAESAIAPWVPPEVGRRVGLSDIVAEATAAPSLGSHARRQRYGSVFNVVSLRVAQLRHRTHAAFGLGQTDPWGDRRIAEFVCAVPQWVVQRRSDPKALARGAMRGVLPEPARQQARRHGPYGLFRRAFDEREVATVRELFRDSRAAAHGWLDAERALGSYEAYLGGADLQHDFWFPLCVELWLRRWWE